MHLDSWKSSSLDLLARWHPCLQKQEDLDWVLVALRLQRCRRRFGLPASLIATLFAILCGANLKYGSLKSLAAKPRIWSRRWRRCWALSTGTPWWRPAWTWGPGSRLLLTLTTVLIKKMILDMCCAVLCHLKVRRKKFRIYRCHPVKCTISTLFWIHATCVIMESKAFSEPMDGTARHNFLWKKC